jgi:hypothetical protein
MMVALCHALFFQLQHRPCRLHQGEDICVSDDWGIGCSFTLWMGHMMIFETTRWNGVPLMCTLPAVFNIFGVGITQDK